MMSHTLNLGGAPVDHAVAVALLIGSFTSSVASALGRKLTLPEPEGR